MKYSAVILLTAALATAIPHASPVAAPAPSVSVQAYDPSTDPETIARQQNAAQVTCKMYQGGSVNDALAPCNPFCGNLKPQQTQSGVNVSSVSCLSMGGVGTAPPTGTDSKGKYTIGVCRCNLGLVDEIAGAVVAALPAIGEIGCEVFMDAFETVFKIGAMAIPGAGEVDAADAGTQALVKGAQAIKKAAGHSDDFFSWINKAACGNTPATSAVDKVFDDITLGQGAGSGGTGNINSDASISTSASSTKAPAASSTAKSAAASTTKAAASTTKAASSGAQNALSVLQAALTTGNKAKATSSAKKAKRTSILSA